MELQVVGTEGIPDGCVLSVRAGSTRRQAPVAADRPFRFPAPASEALPFKVDVLEPVASARLILRPGEERRRDCQYTIPLESAAAAAAELVNGALPPDEAKKDAKEPEMSVTIAVKPSDDAKDDPGVAKTEGGEDPSRPGSSKKRASTTSSASSRHGQASAAREYLDQHNLVEFTQLLVQSVIKEQPERPYAFMAKQFYFPDPKPRPTTTVAGEAGEMPSSSPQAGPHHQGEDAMKTGATVGAPNSKD
eukprot:TRINITY_DN7411_c0_g1_i1.p1 TRINITY_DN7411_c0_g1~~TRINITY_DN7411_c0_g1_i1.p1  ORF type:complete len:248 (+),score=69.53 TRINITY_DN7411_c0_g1_i1:74-817(+)